MKPKPLASLNHLTVPVAMRSFLAMILMNMERAVARGDENQGLELTN
jgi:hypothetical protein